MIKQKDINFSKINVLRKGRKVGEEVIGRLELTGVMLITEYERQSSHIDLEDYAKERITKSIWDRLYRELEEKVHELGLHAVWTANFPHDSIREKELYETLLTDLRTLLVPRP